MVREAICSLSGRCGGCSLLTFDYFDQLESKKQRLKYLFSVEKIKHLPEIKVFFKDEYFYRNRMDFAFSENGLSLREKGKFYKLVPVKKCFIANERINFLLFEINEWFEKNRDKLDIFNIKKNTGTLRYAVIRASYYLNCSTITFIFNKNSERLKEQKEILYQYCKNSSANNILYGYVKPNSDLSSTDDYEIIKGNDLLNEKLKNFTYFYHSQGFFQNNSKVTEDIMEFLKEKIGEEYDFLVDFYGGIGTFGIFLSQKAKEIIIADNSKANLSCAEKNIKENNILNARVIMVEDSKPGIFLDMIKNKKTLFVVDPPRAGIHKNSLKLIQEILPEKILYISCNPKNMVKDVSLLLEKYNIRDIAIFDMFPQTEHMEVVVVMEKDKGKFNEYKN